MSKIYSTGKDTWVHGSHVRFDNVYSYLGPCPDCGSRTFDYGGNWACVNWRCSRSPERIVCSNGPKPDWWDTDIRVYLDGSAWCAVWHDFVDIQTSACGFGSSPQTAVSILHTVPRFA